MRLPPFAQYSAAFAMVAGACVRGLRMIAYEEERRARDDVLIALNALREEARDRGIDIPANLVLSVFEKQTGETATASLSNLSGKATERKAVRDSSNAFDVMDEALEWIETERKVKRDG